MNHHPGNINCQADILVVLFLCFGSILAHGQLSRPGIPHPLYYNGSPVLKVYDITVTETQRTRAMRAEGPSMLKPAKSGMMMDVYFSPDSIGTWDTLSDNLKIWRAAFHIEDARMMNMIFAPYRLNKGVRIFLYDPEQNSVLGAFTDLNNKPVNLLATAHIPGDIVVVEIQVPVYVSSLGSFAISGIGCDFSDKYKAGALKDGWFGKSGSCNIDINCVNDSLVQLLKKSVVRIVFSGGERCTGTLINNTRQDGTAYVLTAGHCIDKEAVANASVFYFDYESPVCSGSDGNAQKSISGATIRATHENLDFTLLELLEPVPFIYQPYYAGWDYSGNPPLSGFIIHHPLGDVKKISRENHALTIASFGEGYDENSHYLVSKWESGTTEAGSSGGAFFDQYGHLAGTLTGGLANCTASVKDYFQMFSHSWNDYPQPQNQLEYWLDPLDKQDGFLNGFDPFSDFKTTGDTLTNMLTDELLTTETGTLAWGSYSGHNSDHLAGFAEKFTVASGKKMPGFLLHVAGNYVANAASMIRIKVWNGTDSPASILFETTIPLSDLSEETVNFIEFDSVITVPGTFFVGYELDYVVPQDTFSAYMAENRLADPVNTAYVHDGYHWQSLLEYTGGNISSSFAIMPVIFDSIPEYKNTHRFADPVVAYPNPAGSSVWIEFLEISAMPVQVTMFNMQGETVFERSYGPYLPYIRLEHLGLGSGIYMIRVKVGNSIHNIKIVIIK